MPGMQAHVENMLQGLADPENPLTREALVLAGARIIEMARGLRDEAEKETGEEKA
jgi:hypothetical protein